MNKINRLLMHLVANARKNYAGEDDCLNDTCFGQMEDTADEDLRIAGYTIAHVLDNTRQAKIFTTDIDTLNYFHKGFSENAKQTKVSLSNLMYDAELAEPGKKFKTTDKE